MNKIKYLQSFHQRRALLLSSAAIPALAWARALRAQQQGKVWRVGFLAQRTRRESLDADMYGAFVRGMRELGYVEGRNLVIEWRYADGKVERLPELAAELTRLNVDAIVTASTPATSAAQKATRTIPIVMGTVGDPVGSGFIKSLARPGGNITGLTNILVELSAKHLEMLLSLAPRLSRVAVLVNPDNASNIETVKFLQAAARRTNARITAVETRTADDIERAFPRMAREHTEAIVLAQDGLFIEHRQKIAELAKKHRLPSIAAVREFAEEGVLISYGPNFTDIYRRTAIHIDKILKGAKPADLPVEQPTVFDLFVNLKTAKALGLKMPPTIMVQATKVIE